jgi:hypothetical protein
VEGAEEAKRQAVKAVEDEAKAEQRVYAKEKSEADAKAKAEANPTNEAVTWAQREAAIHRAAKGKLRKAKEKVARTAKEAEEMAQRAKEAEAEAARLQTLATQERARAEESHEQGRQVRSNSAILTARWAAARRAADDAALLYRKRLVSEAQNAKEKRERDAAKSLWNGGASTVLVYYNALSYDQRG